LVVVRDSLRAAIPVRPLFFSPRRAAQASKTPPIPKARLRSEEGSGTENCEKRSLKLGTVAVELAVVPPTSWIDEVTTTLASRLGKNEESELLVWVGVVKITLLVFGFAVFSDMVTIDPTPVLAIVSESSESSSIILSPLTVATVYVNDITSVCPIVTVEPGIVNDRPGPSPPPIAANVATVIVPGSTAVAPPVGVEL